MKDILGMEKLVRVRKYYFALARRTQNIILAFLLPER
jgi:hypothetical protein